MAQNRTRSITATQFVALLATFLGFSMLLGVLGAGLFVPVAGSGAIVAKAVPSIFDELPSDLEIVHPAEESVMLDATGRVIARFYDKQRIVVPSDKIAEPMKIAMVAIEDKRFYEHKGIDATGIGRAFLNNLGGEGTQGASTITQQFVRNALTELGYLEGNPDLVSDALEQTPQRKLREIKYALALEKRMTKDEILTGYLNIAPFGPITYGVEAASQLYFSKSAAELDMGEAALLAGLVQSPVEYDPLRNPEAAQERRDTVLQVMYDENLLTRDDYEQIKALSVDEQLNPNFVPEGCIGADEMNGYFCSYAINEFLQDETYGETVAEREHLLKTGGLTIRTTLDPDKQVAARETLLGAIPDDDASGLDTALVSLVPSTGQIVAMAQNTSYGLSEGKTMSNYAADGFFQIGSTFKIFALVEWFKQSRNAYEPVGRANTTYYNGEFRCHGQPLYTETYTVNDLGGNLKKGSMDTIRATGLSANQAFVNMASKVDLCDLFQTAASFGITQVDGEPIDPVPANVLGSGSASPLDVAGAFATLANDGVRCKAQSLSSVTDAAENVLKEYQPQCEEVIPSDVARKTTTVLNLAVNQYYTSTRLADGRPFAAKSGTTDSNSNTWLSGFTPELATSAWVGYANASQTSVNDVVINGVYYDAIYGETFVGQHIWAPYMSRALANTPASPLASVYIGTRPVVQSTANATNTQGNNQNQQQQPGTPNAADRSNSTTQDD